MPLTRTSPALLALSYNLRLSRLPRLRITLMIYVHEADRVELRSTCGFVITAHQVCIIHSGAGGRGPHCARRPRRPAPPARTKIYPDGPQRRSFFVRSFSLLIYFPSLSRGLLAGFLTLAYIFTPSISIEAAIALWRKGLSQDTRCCFHSGKKQ